MNYKQTDKSDQKQKSLCDFCQKKKSCQKENKQIYSWSIL